MLQVLKTIGFVYSYKSSQLGSGKTETDEAALAKINESFYFAPLWQKLGDCLSVIEQKADVACGNNSPTTR